MAEPPAHRVEVGTQRLLLGQREHGASPRGHRAARAPPARRAPIRRAARDATRYPRDTGGISSRSPSARRRPDRHRRHQRAASAIPGNARAARPRRTAHDADEPARRPSPERAGPASAEGMLRDLGSRRSTGDRSSRRSLQPLRGGGALQRPHSVALTRVILDRDDTFIPNRQHAPPASRTILHRVRPKSNRTRSPDHSERARTHSGELATQHHHRSRCDSHSGARRAPSTPPRSALPARPAHVRREPVCNRLAVRPRDRLVETSNHPRRIGHSVLLSTGRPYAQPSSPQQTGHGRFLRRGRKLPPAIVWAPRRSSFTSGSQQDAIANPGARANILRTRQTRDDPKRERRLGSKNSGDCRTICV